MIRAVLDTNVLVSNLLCPGPSRTLVSQAGATFQLVLSSPILAEVDDVLRRPRIVRKLHLTEENRNAYLDRLRLLSAPLVPGLLEIDPFEPDPKDTPLLACSLEGHADYLVTGDQALLNLSTYHDTKIASPRAFLDILEKQEPDGAQPPSL